MTRQYKIGTGGFKVIRNQLIIKVVPFAFIAASAGIAINYANLKKGESESFVTTLPIIIPVVVFALGLGFYISIKRQKKIFESYTLTLSDNLITREQFNTPTISIYLNDIKEIIKGKKGGILVNGKDKEDLIIIFPQIENIAELEKALDEIVPITTKMAIPFWQKYPVILPLLTVGLMIGFFTTMNKIVTVITGALLAGLLILSLYKVQKSQNFDIKTRRGAWWGLIPIFAVILRMIIILMKLQ